MFKKKMAVSGPGMSDKFPANPMMSAMPHQAMAKSMGGAPGTMDNQASAMSSFAAGGAVCHDKDVMAKSK